MHKIIKELKETSGRNDKLAILERNKGNEQLKKFFKLCLDPYINFWIKKLPDDLNDGSAVDSTLDEMMVFLEETIATRKITGHEAIKEIHRRMNSLEAADKELVTLMLRKTPDCGVLRESVNETWEDLIPKYPCLLATPYDEKLAKKIFDTAKSTLKKVFMQLKSDGLRVNIVVDHNGGVQLFTRAGNELSVFGAFDFLGAQFKGVVFDGELLTINQSTGKFNIRQVSNGIGNKAVRGTISQEEAEALHAVLWDCIPFDDFKALACEQDYETRYNKLVENLSTLGQNSKVSIIPSQEVKDIEEADKILKSYIAKGEEGGMLKSGAMLWGDERSKLQLKMKLEVVNEFKVVGFKEGTGKLELNLGSLELESEDGLVKVSASGIGLKERSEFYAALTGNPVKYTLGKKECVAHPTDSDIKIGTIFSITHGGMLESNGEYSVFLPRVEKIRLDKTVADDFATISKAKIG